jgi:hypothetical protein
MLITAEDLSRTLQANDLILVGDGAGFQFLNRGLGGVVCLGVSRLIFPLSSAVCSRRFSSSSGL